MEFLIIVFSVLLFGACLFTLVAVISIQAQDVRLQRNLARWEAYKK